MASVERSANQVPKSLGNEKKHVFATREELIKAAIEMSTWSKVNLMEIVTKPQIPMNELSCISPQACFVQHKLVA